MTWVKICGTTNLEDAMMAVEAGADALGFIFAESPRQIDAEAAGAIIKSLPSQVEKVGVFVDESVDKIREIVEQAGLSAVQVHLSSMKSGMSDLLVMSAKERRTKMITAISARVFDDDLLVTLPVLKDGDAVLIDSGSGSKPGGTGKTFDWQKAQGMVQTLSLKFPVIIAGGLKAENVGEAIRLFRPWGVDVVSGVERAPGKKDPAKLRAFVKAVRQAEKVQ